MTSTSDTWVAEALERALDDLAVARLEYESAVIKLHKVEEAVRSLQALNGDDEDEDDAFEIDPTLAAERNRIVHGGPAAQPPKRKQSVNSSTMRVVRVLHLMQKPMNAEAIVESFRINNWPESDGAIQQAARRCQGYGYVWRDPERRYVLTRSGTEAVEKAVREDQERAPAEARQENSE